MRYFLIHLASYDESGFFLGREKLGGIVVDDVEGAWDNALATVKRTYPRRVREKFELQEVHQDWQRENARNLWQERLRENCAFNNLMQELVRQ